MRTTLPSPGQPGNAEKTFVVFVLLLSLGTFMNLTVTGPVETQNMGMVGMQILWSLLYLVTLALYIRSCSRPVRQLLTYKWIESELRKASRISTSRARSAAV